MLRNVCNGVIGAVLVGTASVISAISSLSAQAPPRTVWDGVYTDPQAGRASLIFSQSCGGCHSLTPTGQGPLAGEKFWEGYSQQTVGDLLGYIKANMPNGNGGSLPGPMYNDLVALILKSNGFPPGTTELTAENGATVQIVPKTGPGELPASTLVRIVGCLTRSGDDWALIHATTPERVERSGPDTADGSRPLGTRTTTLKFVLTRLDGFLGQRVSVSGMLMGEGGADGINVTTVHRVANACP